MAHQEAGAPGRLEPGHRFPTRTEAAMMIETRGLRKSFRTRKGTVDAVRGVDLVVEEGEIFGFLGPNGAGKTTTLRILATLITPDGGDATITGLDPQSRAHMWDEVRRLRDEGMTVFITTHYLEEADALCDRIAIIDNGVLVAEGTPTELKREVAGDVVTVGLNGSAPRAATLLSAEAYVRRLEPVDSGVRLYVDSGAVAIP